MTFNPKAADITKYLSEPSVASREICRLFGPNEAKTIFDIGACEGEDSIRFAKLFPKSRVYTFEPLPDNQARILMNFEQYGPLACELVSVALSDSVGEAVFHVSSGSPPDKTPNDDWNYGNKSSSLLAPSETGPMHGWIEFKESIRVVTNTLNEFCRQRSIERIDFIYMDVQGAEFLVLKGADKMLSRIGAVWMEVASRELYRGQALDTEISRFMREHGFVLAEEFYLGSEYGEGDHFYVNRRRVRNWPYLITLFFRKARRRLLRLSSP